MRPLDPVPAEVAGAVCSVQPCEPVHSGYWAQARRAREAPWGAWPTGPHEGGDCDAAFSDSRILHLTPHTVAFVDRFKQEVKMLLGALQDSHWMLATWLYGAGLRLLECLRLRAQDSGFDTHQIVVREGKGNTDRLTMLPAMINAPLMSHLARVRTRYQQDLERGFGRVYLPDALRRKYPHRRARVGLAVGFPSIKG